MKKSFEIDSIDQLKSLAETLKIHAKAGFVFLLKGDLGSGKTTFTAQLIRALGCNEEITSPTFNLVHTYNIAGLEIWHFDLYRLKKPEEVFELGIEDALRYGVSIIEWPELIESVINIPNKITIQFIYNCSNNSRRAEVTI